jgi:hypothetical protein
MTTDSSIGDIIDKSRNKIGKYVDVTKDFLAKTTNTIVDAVTKLFN